MIGQDRKPIEGALVTLLLKGPDQPGGEEHYRVAVTDANGSFTLADAPTGQYLLKAYAPDTIYVSRIVALEDGRDAGRRSSACPTASIENPTVSSPKVERTASGTTLVHGRRRASSLDPNYTLAVNPGAGLVFELHNRGRAARDAGRATIDEALDGPWIFLAVDKTCNVSDFLTVGG